MHSLTASERTKHKRMLMEYWSIWLHHYGWNNLSRRKWKEQQKNNPYYISSIWACSIFLFLFLSIICFSFSSMQYQCGLHWARKDCLLNNEHTDSKQMNKHAYYFGHDTPYVSFQIHIRQSDLGLKNAWNQQPHLSK